MPTTALPAPPAGTIAGVIFDTASFRALYTRLRDQPRLARMPRLRLEGPPASVAERFAWHARRGHP